MGGKKGDAEDRGGMVRERKGEESAERKEARVSAKEKGQAVAVSSDSTILLHVT
jgi:predicted amidohydrolase YtcJ